MTKIEEILFERFSLNEELYQENLNKFIKDGVLKDFPSKEIPRVCIFIYCSRMFEFDKEYLRKYCKWESIKLFVYFWFL